MHTQAYKHPDVHVKACTQTRKHELKRKHMCTPTHVHVERAYHESENTDGRAMDVNWAAGWI